MRERLLFLAVTTLAIVACSSSDYDQPQPRRGNWPGSDNGDGTFARARTTPGVLDMLPPPDWWHDPQIATPLNLSSDQYAALDKIATEQADPIARLDRDSMVAVRDLRQLLESNQPASADIVSAGQRLRGLRDALFDRQVQMLAAERQVLTLQQWETLQAELQSRPRGTDSNRGYPRRGGRGGMGGRGRWPGF
jgi:Spy/CpxP family protein refolding chaperone